jgi:hypothetical protein
MGKKRFDEYIKEFRAQGKIPPVWSVADIRPLLQGIFSDNTIGVYPNNFSASFDGRIKGDTVKRGMKPKYYRVGRGKFVLVEEYDSVRSEVAPIVPTSLLAADSKADGPLPDSQRSDKAKAPIEQIRGRFEAIERRLREAFPSKERLMEYAGVILRHRHAGISDLVADPDFHGLVYRTLISWDMNYRNAKLVSLTEFSKGIKTVSDKICELSAFSMDELGDGSLSVVIAGLEDLFRNFKVMESKSQIVGCSKALHFLLPRLVTPIDGKYTLKFLFGYRIYPRSLDAEARLFTDIFQAFLGLARRLCLSRADEMETGWNTTVPKIIDNAIIGYMKAKGAG